LSPGISSGFLSKSLGDGADRVFGATIDSEPRENLVTGDRGKIGDMATALARHHRKRCSETIENTLHIDIDHAVLVPNLQRHQRINQHHTGMIDEDV
jgi:hypothetical protein